MLVTPLDFGDADGGSVLGRDAEVFELAPVELNAGFAQDMLEDQSADEMADGEAVRLGDFVDVIGGDQTAGAGHVFDDEGRIAGNMLAQVARDGARVGVVAAAGGAADDDADRFAFVEWFLREGASRGP